MSAAERLRPQVPDLASVLAAAPPRPTIHASKLGEGKPDSPIREEWSVYRSEVMNWVAEGREGQWVLIHGGEVIGFWSSEAEADAVRLDRFPTTHVLMKQIREWEPILRVGRRFQPWVG